MLIGAGAPIGVHASSLPGYDSSYWFKWRTKHVRKSVYVYQINPSTWKIRQRKILYKGTKIRLFNSANLSWTIKARSCMPPTVTLGLLKVITIRVGLDNVNSV